MWLVLHLSDALSIFKTCFAKITILSSPKSHIIPKNANRALEYSNSAYLSAIGHKLARCSTITCMMIPDKLRNVETY